MSIYSYHGGDIKCFSDLTASDRASAAAGDAKLASGDTETDRAEDITATGTGTGSEGAAAAGIMNRAAKTVTNAASNAGTIRSAAAARAGLSAPVCSSRFRAAAAT
jgi:hypothetical protein